MTWTAAVFDGYRRRLAELQASDHPFAQGVAWVGGDYVIANVPGIQYLPGGKTKPFTSPEIVRSLSAAHRLINACA